MSVKERLQELKEYMDYKKKDILANRKLIDKSTKRAEKNESYRVFKASINKKLEELLKNGGKVCFSTKEENYHLFQKLYEDEDFNLHYNMEVNEENLILISTKGLDE